ncbi:MAG: endonuclease III domain-containing protein [Deltaproteobacteria bacterium]|nr:endonuclease III domain-containing protein [Deltaproteobacteria bacterium]
MNKPDQRPREIFTRLLQALGPQHWWPAESREETIIGAILTQNTSWVNVEKAIAALRQRRLLAFSRLEEMAPADLAAVIRPSGYYNQKAARLREFSRRLRTEHGTLERLETLDTGELRSWLLSVKGIGPETADSILLYAFGRPVFVVDAYTGRIFSRHGLVTARAGYDDIQAYVHRHLPPEPQVYNEFHALLVNIGKNFCRRRQPACQQCPLQELLPDRQSNPGEEHE